LGAEPLREELSEGACSDDRCMAARPKADVDAGSNSAGLSARGACVDGRSTADRPGAVTAAAALFFFSSGGVDELRADRRSPAGTGGAFALAAGASVVGMLCLDGDEERSTGMETEGAGTDGTALEASAGVDRERAASGGALGICGTAGERVLGGAETEGVLGGWLPWRRVLVPSAGVCAILVEGGLGGSLRGNGGALVAASFGPPPDASSDTDDGESDGL
jgi:hypothetical protein